jgi:hypothetical protein
VTSYEQIGAVLIVGVLLFVIAVLWLDRRGRRR